MVALQQVMVVLSHGGDGKTDAFSRTASGLHE